MHCDLDRIIREQIKILAVTLRPSSIYSYRSITNRFLCHLHLNFPEVQSVDQLQRNPHILSWLRSLVEANRPLSNATRIQSLLGMRRLFNDLADTGYPVRQPLILAKDFPPCDQYLPKAISPEVDEILNRQLRMNDDLLSNALLLIRATGIRIGECVSLKRDSLRYLGADHWVLHVPLGKLHNERLVPMDEDARNIFKRILCLSVPVPDDAPNAASTPLLLLPNGNKVSHHRLRRALKNASKRAGCAPVRPHQLRHTFATAMIRGGISLTALKEILGHRDIRMTMVYVQVTQNDLQREYRQARQNIASVHAIPQLPAMKDVEASNSGIAAICCALDAVKHQLEMYRRQISHQSAERKLHSLARRLAKLRTALSAFQGT
jgi:site-specific recombinase XerD